MAAANILDISIVTLAVGLLCLGICTKLQIKTKLLKLLFTLISSAAETKCQVLLEDESVQN